eukprot:g8351.t1
MVEAYHGQDKISNFVQGIAGDGKLGHVDLLCAIVNQKVDAGLVVNEKGHLYKLSPQTFLKLPKVSTTELANFEAQVAQCAKDKEQRKAFRAFLQTYVVGLQSTSNFEPGAHILNLPETLKLDPAVSLGGFSDSSLTYKQVTRATRKAQEHSEPAGLEEDGAALIRLFNSE